MRLLRIDSHTYNLDHMIKFQKDAYYGDLDEELWIIQFSGGLTQTVRARTGAEGGTHTSFARWLAENSYDPFEINFEINRTGRKEKGADEY